MYRWLHFEAKEGYVFIGRKQMIRLYGGWRELVYSLAKGIDLYYRRKNTVLFSMHLWLRRGYC